MQLRQFQITEADVERLVDESLDFPHLVTKQLLVEDFEAHAVWLFDELLALLLACAPPDVGPLLLILGGFPVYRFVHQLEELLFEFGIRIFAQPLDIRAHERDCWK